MRLPSDQDATGRTFGPEELALLTEVMASGTLTSTKGTMTARLEKSFAQVLGVKHVIACNSGSAAVHCAVAALDLEPGNEVITTAITDMGALAPILFQGAIPVFADVDPHTYNVTAETIAARITPRTKAIVVTHLFGNPCEMRPIEALAARHGLPIIEDCAQSFLATESGRTVGSIGTIGCFSLQQGKHITCGEGGLVATNDDALARRIFLFVNKAWGYGDKNPDHYFLALNYRQSELQSAVALGQLPKLQGSVDARRALAAEMDERLGDIAGVETPRVTPGATHVYWKYCLRVQDDVPGGVDALAKSLREKGVACAPRYIQKPAFRCEVFRDQRTFGKSRWPFTLATPEALDYSRERFVGTYDALEHVLVLPWCERYEEQHLDYLAGEIRAALSGLGVGA